MNKKELIEKMAIDASIPKNRAHRALDSFLSSIIEGIRAKEGKVTS